MIEPGDIMGRALRRQFTYCLFATLTLSTSAHSQRLNVSDYFSRAAFAEGGHESGGMPDPATPALEPDAVRLANQLLLERNGVRGETPSRKGGLYLGGDVTNAFTRLEWIVGHENIKLLRLEPDGSVTLNLTRLARAARIEESARGDASRRLATYISGNEGLLLFLQLAKSSHRYLLYLGKWTPTEGGVQVVRSAMNLDNNFDSRINPLRRNRVKLSRERPPQGFDSLVAINPGALWFNMERRQLVTPGNLTFHELAEAHAKLELGLDYLSQGASPGAHDIAIEREERLLSQRPLSNMVITKGMNRSFATAAEALSFTSRLSKP